MTTALVTGGAGFIGSHLVDRLLGGGDTVVVVDSFFLGKEANLAPARVHGDRLTVYREDAADEGAMRAIVGRHEPEVVFNLATKALRYSFFNPAGAGRVNVDVALTLAELLRAGSYDHLVHVSSSEVYGSAERVPMDEDHPLLPETTYAAGKAAADLVLASYVRMFDLDIRVVRPFNNYGPRQNDGDLAAIVPLTVRRILAGQRPVLEGDGAQTRDFTFVADTVAGIVALAAHPKARGTAVNLGSGRETSMRLLVETIASLLGYHGEIELAPPRPADVLRHCADVGRAEALIGPVASCPLEEGLARTIDWYRGST
jgi:UDP-glucose 4-epimerase